MKSIHIRSVSIIVIGLILIVAGCSSPPPTTGVTDPEMAPRIGALAPDFTLSTLQGENFTLSETRGQPTMLNFWASWCGPCRIEMPHLQSAYEHETQLGVEIITVNIGEAESNVSQFASNNDYTFRILLDQRQVVASLYQIVYLPTTFFIDGEGIIRNVKIGPFRNEADIVAQLKFIQ